MSLFRQLERLYRPNGFQREDFHTEIVAQVLQNSPALTLAWLGRVGVTSLQEAKIRISTQETFEKLPGHSTASRPDIVIRLVTAGKTELIFIESKLPSKQGEDQLERYAEQLTAETQNKGLAKASLVFITRDYEAASAALMADPRFKVARWFQFYQFLKAHANGDGLAEQLKLFMKENHMSLGHQFRSVDLVALENFLSAKALMNETLEGEVRTAASDILGEVSTLTRVLNQLRDHHRYIICNANWNDFGCLLGYWLPHEDPDEPVWVGITFESNPSSPIQKEVIEAFRGWLAGAGHDWKSDGLDDETAWSSIHKGKALPALFGEPDHVRAIKDYFLALLKEAKAFRKAYPKLPWGVVGGTNPDEEDDDPSTGIPLPPEEPHPET